MNAQNLKIPYFSKAEIYKVVELFRKQYWNQTIPVDIETIIDVKLGINIVPKPDLLKLYGFDAYLAPNWQNLVVDNDLFIADSGRLRFSYAHEVGHLILYKNLYEKFELIDPGDISRFYDELPGDQHHFVEAQAHIFANFLLIPRDELRKVRKIVMDKFLSNNKIDLKEIDPKILNQYLAGPISKYFGVSPIPVEIALQDLNK